MEIKTKNGFRFLYPEHGKYLKKDDVITDYVILGSSADASDWQEITEQKKLEIEQEREKGDGVG